MMRAGELIASPTQPCGSIRVGDGPPRAWCSSIVADPRASTGVLEASSERRDGLGAPLATDVDRTYRLRAAGFDVSWAGIPECITLHHRILVARPR